MAFTATNQGEPTVNGTIAPRPSPQSRAEGQHLEAIDRVALLERLGGDLLLMAELAQLFLDECPAALEQVQSAVRAGDAAHLKRAAHFLAGSLSNLSATVACDLARQLERCGSCGDLTAASTMLAAFQAELQKVNRALTTLAQSSTPQPDQAPAYRDPVQPIAPSAMAEQRPIAPTAAPPLLALVVDDCPVDRRLAGNIVEQCDGMRVLYAADGKEALKLLRTETPAIIVTDLQMPRLNGLELVAEIRERELPVPVILMTAVGSEEIAAEALRLGAASYVSKKNLTRDLPRTLAHVLAAAKADRQQQSLLSCVSHFDSRFVLDNDAGLVPLLVTHIQDYFVRMSLCDPKDKVRIGVALEEALLNGIHHGNLELSSSLREGDGQAYQQLAVHRRRQAPYRDRRLHVHAQLGPAEAVVEICDEGPGFDPSTLPDPTDPENLVKASGRGLMLIRTFMDEVFHNATGNQITLIKRPPSMKRA